MSFLKYARIKLLQKKKKTFRASLACAMVRQNYFFIQSIWMLFTVISVETRNVSGDFIQILMTHTFPGVLDRSSDWQQFEEMAAERQSSSLIAYSTCSNPNENQAKYHELLESRGVKNMRHGPEKSGKNSTLAWNQIKYSLLRNIALLAYISISNV